jgi:4-hydroxybenzoate polyprenyltransferase
VITATPGRWWVYQRERFPILAHGPLVAAFSFSGVCYSLLLRGQPGAPALPAVLAAFVTSLLFFLQLRIADEFKDFEEDSRYRPYRAVPRGLVRLHELGIIGVAAGLVQIAFAVWLQPAMILLLLPTWLYLALMCREFFVREWLKKHAFTYMWSHMMIMPLIDFYVTSCDWRGAQARPPEGLLWFLLVSFFNGLVIELGRKIRAPEDEEVGVETYTALWGRPTAIAAWLTALGLTTVFAALATARIGFLVPAACLLGVLLTIAALIAVRFLRSPVSKTARPFELFSGIWTLLMYLSVGAVPWAVRYFHLVRG